MSTYFKGRFQTGWLHDVNVLVRSSENLDLTPNLFLFMSIFTPLQKLSCLQIIKAIMKHLEMHARNEAELLKCLFNRKITVCMFLPLIHAVKIQIQQINATHKSVTEKHGFLNQISQ